MGPFRVLERIGRLAYRLNIPEDWKIYDIFTIAQLEPCLDPSEDPFKWPRPAKPGPILADRDDTPPEWELDRILDKRVVPRGRGVSTEYLLRWQGWGSEWDRWINVKNMNADELIAEYEQHAAQKPVRKRGRPRKDACTLHLFFSCVYVSGAAFVYPYYYGGHGIFSICGILIQGAQTYEACLGRTLPRLMLSQPQPYELAYQAHLPHRTMIIFTTNTTIMNIQENPVLSRNSDVLECLIHNG